MRFGIVHRLMIDALASLGILAVVSTASLNTWTNVALLVGLALALAIPEGWQGHPALRRFATVAPLVLLVVQGTRLIAGRSPLDVAVEFAALLQIVRLATRRGAAHDQQIIVLALLHFIAGTVLGGGLTYGLCFVGFLVVAPGALVLSHLRREVEGNYRQGARDRTGLPVDVPRILKSRRVVGRGFLAATCLLAVPILLFTVILFLLFPRIGLSLLLLSHPRAGHMIGFSERIDLGDVGTLRDDPTIALRFEISDLPSPAPVRMTLRLRGTALDQYERNTWIRSRHDLAGTPMRVADPAALFTVLRDPAPQDRHVSIDLEPIEPPVVFLPPHAVAFRVKPPSTLLLGQQLTIQRGAEREYRYGGAESHGLRYEVLVAPADEAIPESLPHESRERYLAVPPDLPARVGVLAHTWTDGLPTLHQKAIAIERHLSHDYIYDLRSPSGGKPQPLDDFLFVSHAGHCEFFSTAMAIMLRTIGIPSRNVTGFVGGTWNRFGHYYAVRQGDAHSWVEAFIEEGDRPASWQTFDPTPTSAAQPLEPPTGLYYYARDFIEALSQRWNTYVVGYDLQKQVRLFDDVNRRYQRARDSIGRDLQGRVLARAARHPVFVTLGLLACLAAYAAWRWRTERARAPSSGSTHRPGAASAAIVALFRRLDLTLHGLGLGRPATVPPLRHAENVRAGGHQAGTEAIALTEIYLAARFGGHQLDEASLLEFARRTRTLATLRDVRPAKKQ